MPFVVRALRLFDWLIAIPLIPAAFLLKFVRRVGLQRLPVSRSVLRRVGVIPVRNHYYEPWVDEGMLERPLDEDRALPGIDMAVDTQLETLQTLTYANELLALEDPSGTPLGYRFGNEMFEQGDAEVLYSLIRSRKPARVFEIGSGNSTLVVRKAIAATREEDPTYSCEHVCVEPYEADWLESSGAKIVRERAERLGADFFDVLEAGDLLFIDSSHMVRPQGDVLFELLELLPTLRRGVLVHLHDIFTPKDYPREWVVEIHRFWNEQYLLEAFLTNNSDWKVVLSLNYLKHHHFAELQTACPNLREGHEPGSFYLERKID